MDRQPVLLDAFLEQVLVADKSEVSGPYLATSTWKHLGILTD